MKKSFSKLLLLSSAFVMTNPILAQRASVEPPTGLLNGNAKAEGAATMWNWILISICVSGAAFFGITAARNLSDSRWLDSVGPIIATVLCATILFLVFTFSSTTT